jgi:hypothetical protein
MSSTSHLTATQTNETKVNKRHSSFNLRTTPSDVSSDLLHSLSPPTNPNYLHYLNAESLRKQSITITQHLTSPPSITGPSLNIRRKLSAISLPIPWYKRTRSPSDDKTSTDSISKHAHQQQQKSHNPHKMSRDRLLTLDRLFSSGTRTSTTTNDDEQASPTTEFTALDTSLKSNEKIMKSIRENGYLHNTHLMTRLEKF